MGEFLSRLSSRSRLTWIIALIVFVAGASFGGYLIYKKQIFAANETAAKVAVKVAFNNYAKTTSVATNLGNLMKANSQAKPYRCSVVTIYMNPSDLNGGSAAVAENLGNAKFRDAMNQVSASSSIALYSNDTAFDGAVTTCKNKIASNSSDKTCLDELNRSAIFLSLKPDCQGPDSEAYSPALTIPAAYANAVTAPADTSLGSPCIKYKSDGKFYSAVKNGSGANLYYIFHVGTEGKTAGPEEVEVQADNTKCAGTTPPTVVPATTVTQPAGTTCKLYGSTYYWEKMGVPPSMASQNPQPSPSALLYSTSSGEFLDYLPNETGLTVAPNDKCGSTAAPAAAPAAETQANKIKFLFTNHSQVVRHAAVAQFIEGEPKLPLEASGDDIVYYPRPTETANITVRGYKDLKVNNQNKRVFAKCGPGTAGGSESLAIDANTTSPILCNFDAAETPTGFENAAGCYVEKDCPGDFSVYTQSDMPKGTSSIYFRAVRYSYAGAGFDDRFKQFAPVGGATFSIAFKPVTTATKKATFNNFIGTDKALAQTTTQTNPLDNWTGYKCYSVEGGSAVARKGLTVEEVKAANPGVDYVAKPDSECFTTKTAKDYQGNCRSIKFGRLTTGAANTYVWREGFYDGTRYAKLEGIPTCTATKPQPGTDDRPVTAQPETNDRPVTATGTAKAQTPAGQEAGGGQIPTAVAPWSERVQPDNSTIWEALSNTYKNLVGTQRHIYGTIPDNGLQSGIRIEQLPAGLYQIKIEKSGFSSSTFVFELKDNEQLDLNGLSIAPSDFLKEAPSINGSVVSGNNGKGMIDILAGQFILDKDQRTSLLYAKRSGDFIYYPSYPQVGWLQADMTPPQKTIYSAQTPGVPIFTTTADTPWTGVAAGTSGRAVEDCKTLFKAQGMTDFEAGLAATGLVTTALAKSQTWKDVGNVVFLAAIASAGGSFNGTCGGSSYGPNYGYATSPQCCQAGQDCDTSPLPKCEATYPYINGLFGIAQSLLTKK